MSRCRYQSSSSTSFCDLYNDNCLGDLARLARTCKSFSESALRTLWETVVDIETLIRVRLWRCLCCVPEGASTTSSKARPLRPRRRVHYVLAGASTTASNAHPPHRRRILVRIEARPPHQSASSTSKAHPPHRRRVLVRIEARTTIRRLLKESE